MEDKEENVSMTELEFLDKKTYNKTFSVVKYSSYVGVKAYSFYDENDGRRKIKKSDFSGRTMEKVLLDVNRNNFNKTLTQMKNDGLITEEGSYYIIADRPKGRSFISLPTDDVKEMCKYITSPAIIIFMWLYRRYNQRTVQQKRRTLFSKRQIITEIFGMSDQGKNYETVGRLLSELKRHKMIECRKVVVGKTFLEELTSITSEIKSQTEDLEQDRVETEKLKSKGLQEADAADVNSIDEIESNELLQLEDNSNNNDSEQEKLSEEEKKKKEEEERKKIEDSLIVYTEDGPFDGVRPWDTCVNGRYFREYMLTDPRNSEWLNYWKIDRSTFGIKYWKYSEMLEGKYNAQEK